MDTSVINNPQLLVTVSDPTMLTKLKNAIKMLNGVSSISVLKPKKTGLELAEEDKAKEELPTGIPSTKCLTLF